MTTVALDRVQLVHPLGDMGDRNIQGISTAIAGDSWYLEADYHHGSIGDVNLYINTSAHVKDSTPTWKWYAAIPTANIKAYRIANGDPTPQTWVDPSAVPNGESKAATPAIIPAAQSGKP